MPLGTTIKALQNLSSGTVARLNRAYNASKSNSARSTPSGRNSTRGQETPSYKPQTSVNQKTSPRGWNPTWTQSASSASKGLGYKPYDAPSTANPYVNPNPAPKGTNFNINPRGTSALAKGIGGGVAIQATKGGLLRNVLTKANPYVAALLLITDIVLADGEIVSNEDELAAIEEWNRQPGEIKTIEEGVTRVNGGQMAGVRYLARGVIHLYNALGYFHQERDSGLIDVYGPISNIELKLDASESNPNVTAVYFIVEGKDQYGNDSIRKFSQAGSGFTGKLISYSIVRGDGKPDTGGNSPSEGEVKSSPTVNHNNITINKANNVNNSRPLNTRPSFQSKIPSGDVELNISSSESNVTPQPKINNPLPIPEPLPVPEPPFEKTIEEVEQEKSISKQEIKPKIISRTRRRRADGGIETTILRVATEEEMKKFKEQGLTTNGKFLVTDKMIEEGQAKYEFKRNINPFGDETEFFYRVKKNDFSNPEIEETTRQPNSNTGNPPASVPLPSAPSVISKPTPEPDAALTPEPTPDTVIQTEITNNVIEDKIDKLPSVEAIAIAVGGLDILRQIKDKPLPSFLCQAPTLVPPVSAKVTANNQAILGFQALNTGQNAAIQTAVNGVSGAVNTVQDTLSTMQKYAETAWKATRADKIVNALNTMLIIHNGFMLSNNMLDTVSEVAEVGLEILGIRNEEDTPIDIGGAIGSKIKGLLERTLGKARYEELTKDLASKMRIYQSGANMLYNIRSIFDSAQDIAETTGENVAFIGNALRRDGVVRENSYRLMPTDLQPSSRLLYKLERANDALDTIEEVMSDAKDIKEELGEMKENAKVFNEEVEKATDKQQKAIDAAKSTVTSIPAPTEIDEERGIENGE